ncbi:zf-HC2 domain-containing protein [Nocardioides nanhaiensis]|uniref:Zinc-finger domain-containing protein n=1 Tax=Nocardioides nanhaiensis TaxID=1476871 RepID=A0ABP8X3V4_9ACTN
MTPMTHLGPRVSALLDGQLPAAEAELAWQHVHGCHSCRDLVEREGWVKQRLSALSLTPTGSEPPAHLVGSLLGLTPASVGPTGAVVHSSAGVPRRPLGLAALGGSAVGVAVVGVLALGAAPASAPSVDRRAPASNVVSQVPVTSVGGPLARPSGQPAGRVGR